MSVEFNAELNELERVTQERQFALDRNELIAEWVKWETQFVGGEPDKMRLMRINQAFARNHGVEKRNEAKDEAIREGARIVEIFNKNREPRERPVINIVQLKPANVKTANSEYVLSRQERRKRRRIEREFIRNHYQGAVKICFCRP